MLIRKLHRYGGMLAAPIMLITAITGTILLLEESGWFDKEFVESLVPIHNFSFISLHLGFILPVIMLYMVITGAIISISIYKRKKQ